MNKKTYDRIVELHEEYKNVHELLRSEFGVVEKDMIELAYDLQAGSYIENTKKKPEYYEKISSEISEIINKYKPDSILEAGCGELTTLHGIQTNAEKYGFDISYKRIATGIQYGLAKRENVFVADLYNIPLEDNSVSIVYTMHSIESNSKGVESILYELYRVASDYLILFEPSNEISDENGKREIDRKGYCKDLIYKCNSLFGDVETLELKNVYNPLNKTVAIIIEKGHRNSKFKLCCPITKQPINESPYGYPYINGIKILDHRKAVYL